MEGQQKQYIIFGYDNTIMRVARTFVPATPCNSHHTCPVSTPRLQHAKKTDDALREVDVEKVEVERGLHKSCRDGNGVDHVLGEVSIRGSSQYNVRHPRPPTISPERATRRASAHPVQDDTWHVV